MLTKIITVVDNGRWPFYYEVRVTTISASIASPVAGVPTLAVDFQAPGFVKDPYPVLEQIRDVGPIVFHPELGYYMITGYRECARVMGKAAVFGSDVEHFIALFGGATMECMDNPRHDLVKSIWARDFQRGTLQERRGMLEAIAAEQVAPYIERLRSGEAVDVLDLTRSVPTITIARLMGVPDADFEQFVAWSDAMGGVLEARDDHSPAGRAMVARGKAATAEINEYLASEIVRRRQQPGDDLVSKMAVSEIPMAEDEIVASNTQLVFAGNETTSKLMGYTIVALALHPGQREEIRRDRSLLLPAIEEAHRWTSVLVFNLRFVKEDGTEVAGVALPKGATIMALQAAANRDPDRWENPGQFDIHRPPQAHLGFGAGLHSCLGLNLARLETEALINQLLDAVPDWALVAEDQVDYGTNFMVRGPSRIPLVLRAQG
ncbi:MAG: monooxygenase YjiB [Candidatus Dormibacteria bacterium]